MAGAWLLLTQATHAAEMEHGSVIEGVLHYLDLRLSTLIMSLWIFVLGSCIGSFLNVVIYRMPAGRALSHPGSHCPVCETELTAGDNIPILGWVSLRGRCRYCQVLIPSRYPWIEFTVGLLFLTVFVVETSTGAANLPLRMPVTIFGGAMNAIFLQGHWDLLGYFLVHTFYLTITLAICMIGLDGHTTPWKLVRLGLSVALLAGVLWPELRPIHVVVPMSETLIQSWQANWTLSQWLAGYGLNIRFSLIGILDSIAGLTSGLLAGWLAGRVVRDNSAISSTVKNVFILAGLFCGWQMTWPLLTLFLLTVFLLRPFNAKIQQSMLPLLLFGICSVFILAWPQMLNGITLIRYDGWRWTKSSALVDWIATILLLAATALAMSRMAQHTPVTDEHRKDA